MSPGEYFVVRFGPRALEALQRLGIPKLKEGLEEELRQRFDRHQPFAEGIASGTFKHASEEIGFIWRRQGPNLSVLHVSLGAAPDSALASLRRIFKEV